MAVATKRKTRRALSLAVATIITRVSLPSEALRLGRLPATKAAGKVQSVSLAP